MNRKLAVALAGVALLIDFIEVASVSLNLKWVRTYAAGGQYSTFPGSVRIMYLFQVGFVLAVAWFLWKIRDGLHSPSDSNFALVVVCIYAISAASQLVSKSAHEKLNVAPALVIVWAFLTLRKGASSK